MRKYEIMVILDPDTDERQVSPLIEKHLKVITKAKGTVDNTDIWGRRHLAYPINKKTDGIYAVLTVTADPATVQELDRRFGIDEQVLRTKVLRQDA
jgi:small subunit ribosomal protein S6